MFLLDTCVLSNLELKSPDPTLAQWVASPESAKAIPFSAVIEIQRGITLLEEKNPKKAAELALWLNSILERDLPFLAMNAKVARIYAQLTCIPALKHLWLPARDAKQPKLGQDLAIAATAIAYSVSIATMNAKDFLLVDQYARLPGVFDPMIQTWTIPRIGQREDAVPSASAAFRY